MTAHITRYMGLGVAQTQTSSSREEDIWYNHHISAMRMVIRPTDANTHA
jgi:hypothetical protein